MFCALGHLPGRGQCNSLIFRPIASFVQVRNNHWRCFAVVVDVLRWGFAWFDQMRLFAFVVGVLVARLAPICFCAFANTVGTLFLFCVQCDGRMCVGTCPVVFWCATVSHNLVRFCLCIGGNEWLCMFVRAYLFSVFNEWFCFLLSVCLSLPPSVCVCVNLAACAMVGR